MKRLFVPALSLMVIAASSCGGGASTESKNDSTIVTTTSNAVAGDVNVLSDAEKAEGWQLLFDGKNLDGWRVYKGRTANSWTVDTTTGTMHCLGSETDKSDKRGDLITDQQFENFELNADWKLAAKGNSGILYMVTEEFDAPYYSGPEYQIIDDKDFPEKLEDWQKTGANYAMNPPLVMAAKPIGEWNNTKIIVNKGHVEHWLNGEKTADYDMDSPEWKKHKAEGKWKDAPGYGMTRKGHIALQDHGSEIWFKNVKIKELK